ncbi:MAG: class I SAM-dependent methyltransferase [Hyphomicrobiaceae bacterium]
MGWIEYWDDKPTIYVSRRHREAHYRCVADGLGANLGDGRPVVLDFGCGEALFADDVAVRCSRLYLCDAAPSVRAELQRRFASVQNIVVVAPEDLASLPAASLDLVVANSVIQYLSAADLDRCLEDWKRLLAPAGRLLLADVIPPKVGPLTDALALLDFARREGFLVAAFAGLVRTFFSSYRKVRAELGLQQYEADTLLQRLAAHGLSARRHHPNLGHNQARMAFIATLADTKVAGTHV